MPRDLGVADRLRAAGLKVIEVDGWRTRGSENFVPVVSVDHHTAGGRNGNAPSLGICINGRSDLPGPLCHVLLARDNTCYVIAAGRANHAGAGGWAGYTGNSRAFGIERENVGTAAEPWRPDQHEAAARAHAALLIGHLEERVIPDHVCRHAEWATPKGRKTDSHTITGTELRALVRRVLTQPTFEEEFMATLSEAEKTDLFDHVHYIATAIGQSVQMLTNLQGSDAGQAGMIAATKAAVEKLSIDGVEPADLAAAVLEAIEAMGGELFVKKTG